MYCTSQAENAALVEIHHHNRRVISTADTGKIIVMVHQYLEKVGS